MQDRRWIAISISEEDLLVLLGQWRKFGTINLPVLDECRAADGTRFAIPADAEIVDCCYKWESKAFGLRIQHDSFARVPDGQETPWVALTRHTLHVMQPRRDPDNPDVLLIVEVPA